MDHYANKAISPSQVSPDVHLQSPSASIPAPGSFSFDIEEDRDDTNWFGNDAFTLLGTFLPQETPDGPSSINIAPHVPEQFEKTLRHSARPLVQHRRQLMVSVIKGKRPSTLLQPKIFMRNT
jgi:hypothetical protein